MTNILMIVTALFFCLLFSSVFCDCPDGFYRHDDSCYSLSRVQGTWAQASVYCHAIKAQLVSIETQSEGLFVKGLLQNHGSGYDPNEFWLGATDIINEGEWTWTKSATLVKAGNFTDWSPGQPDNGGSNVDDEHCMCVKGDYHYHWNDDNCEHLKHFICEKRLNI